jgi:hypothetical protein
MHSGSIYGKRHRESEMSREIDRLLRPDRGVTELGPWEIPFRLFALTSHGAVPLMPALIDQPAGFSGGFFIAKRPIHSNGLPSARYAPVAAGLDFPDT